MKKKISLLSLLAASIWGLSSCSSSQQQSQPQEAVSNESSENTPEEVTTNPDSEYTDDSATNYGDSAAINNAATTNEFTSADPAVDPAATTNAANAAVPQDQNLAAADSYTAALATTGGNVMYVPQQLYGYASAAESAAPTCTLEKGDHPLLQLTGTWGQIKANQFVKAQEMSAHAVARDRTPSAWR